MKKEPNVIIFDPRIDYLNLYCLNLKVYLNANITVCAKYEAFLADVRALNPDLVLVSLASEEKFADKVSRLNNILKDKFVKPLCFVQAKTKETYSEITIYDNDVPVKDIIGNIAKKMGITAKYMTELNVGDYYPIPLKLILPGWQATQPFYLKDHGEKYSLILAKGKFFTKDLMDDLGVDSNVYCMSSYRVEVINSFTSSIKSILESDKITTEERYEQTEIAFEMISQSVATIGLPDTTMQLAKSTIRSMEKIVTEVSNLSKLYKMLLDDNKSIRFKHALISNYLGQFVLKDQSWNNASITQQWSYLCFFHDILLEKDAYLLFEYDEDVKKSKLPDREKNIILNHAQMAAKIISQMKEIPIGIDTLIKQHHGSKMGNSLSEISMTISPLCIIFILVENYVHFLLSNNEQIKKPEEILDYIDTLFKKYPYPNYKKLIPLLRTIPLKD